MKAISIQHRNGSIHNSENYYKERQLQKYYYYLLSLLVLSEKGFDFTKTPTFTKSYVLDNMDLKQRVAEDLFIFWTDYLCC